MDQRTRKLINMHKALYPRDEVDRLYVWRKVGGSGLDSIEDSVDASIQPLEDYILKLHGGISKWAQKDYKNKLDWVSKVIH